MRKYSNDKNISRFLNGLSKIAGISFKRGAKHHFVVFNLNGVKWKHTIPSTPSDGNSYKNFKKDIEQKLYAVAG